MRVPPSASPGGGVEGGCGVVVLILNPDRMRIAKKEKKKKKKEEEVHGCIQYATWFALYLALMHHLHSVRLIMLY